MVRGPQFEKRCFNALKDGHFSLYVPFARTIWHARRMSRSCLHCSCPPLELAFEWLVFMVNILRVQVSNRGPKTRYPVRHLSWFYGATLQANAVQYLIWNNCRFFWRSFQFVFRFFRKIAISDYQLVLVRPSAWNNSAPTGRIFMKFDISVFFEKYVEKIPVSLNFDKNNGYFTRRPV